MSVARVHCSKSCRVEVLRRGAGTYAVVWEQNTQNHEQSRTVPDRCSRYPRSLFSASQFLQLQRFSANLFSQEHQPECVGIRHYRFLAWSQSQLREHACYLYADRKDTYGLPMTVLHLSVCSNYSLSQFWLHLSSRIQFNWICCRLFPVVAHHHTPVDTIRDWIGVVPDASMTVAKYMSRIGLCFTQGVQTITLQLNDYVIEPDVTTGALDRNGNEYIFR